MDDFTGVKIALINNDKLLVIQRDDKPGLPFASLWDFAGGGREGLETPYQCMSREVQEELGIHIAEDSIEWQSQHAAMVDASRTAYFMVSQISDEVVASIRFGDEGQGWKFMTIDEFMTALDAIGYLKERLGPYLEAKSTSGSSIDN